MTKLPLTLLLLIFVMAGCDERKPDVIINNSGGKLRTYNGILSSVVDIEEFEYKGHLYIYSRVRDGIAMSHAGHCQCNQKNIKH